MSWSFSDIWTFGEDFWLPKQITWELVRSCDDGGIKPQPWHFLLVIALAFGYLALRHLVCKFVTRPVGAYFLVNDRVVARPQHNDVGERLHKKCRGNPKEAEITELMGVTGWSERKAQRWFRQRRLSSLPNKMVKFTDSSWRFIGYFALLVLGLTIVPRKSYFYDLKDAWRHYPARTVDVDEFWYYLLEMAYYLSLTISHFFEQRKKDYWEMLIHHIATLGLISLSFHVNYVPIGALIMLCHDIADPWLELAKLIGYTRRKRELGSHFLKDKLTEVFFIFFAVLFFVTRLVIYPVYLLHSVYYHPVDFNGPWPLHNVFFGLLVTLFFLHMFWSYLICRVITSSILSGHVKGDSRSDDEMTTDDDSRNSTGSATPTSDRTASIDSSEARTRVRHNGSPVLANGEQ